MTMYALIISSITDPSSLIQTPIENKKHISSIFFFKALFLLLWLTTAYFSNAPTYVHIQIAMIPFIFPVSNRIESIMKHNFITIKNMLCFDVHNPIKRKRTFHELGKKG